MQQQTNEWLEMRKKMVGASDAPAIMGVGFKTPFQLWQEKLSLIPPQPKTAAMQRGLDLEGEARLLFTIESGIHVEPKVVISKEFTWMMASLDGVSENGTVAIEIKCPGLEDHDKAVSGHVPEKYIPQLQHQMKVLELDSMIYVSYFNEELTFFEVKRDEQYIKELVEVELEFYDCMTTMTPPKLGDRDYVDRNDQEWVLQAQEWKKINQAIKELEGQEMQARSNLIKMAANQNVRGGNVKVVKVARKGNIAYQDIEVLKDIDLEKYRKEHIAFWKIT